MKEEKEHQERQEREEKEKQEYLEREERLRLEQHEKYNRMTSLWRQKEEFWMSHNLLLDKKKTEREEARWTEDRLNRLVEKNTTSVRSRPPQFIPQKIRLHNEGC